MCKRCAAMMPDGGEASRSGKGSRRKYTLHLLPCLTLFGLGDATDQRLEAGHIDVLIDRGERSDSVSSNKRKCQA